MNLVYQQAYFKILLEEILNNISSSNISLPDPFNNLIFNLKQAMSKAINATMSELKLINQEVNIWRDKLIQAWKQFSNILTIEQKNFLNNTVFDLITKYTQYMHGINTGY